MEEGKYIRLEQSKIYIFFIYLVIILTKQRMNLSTLVYV